MSAFDNFINTIKTAIYGEDVRQSIVDAIKQCYKDATGSPESVSHVVDLVNTLEDDIDDVIENTPYILYEEDDDFELPIQTINDDATSEESTWSSSKITDVIETTTQTIINTIFPVGSIFISVANTNPSTYLGGTWTAWGSGKVPVGVDTAQTEFNSVEKTGGEKTHTLTTTEIPSHHHSYDKTTGGDFFITNEETLGSVIALKNLTITSTNTGNTGSGGSHNNLQPYITCYMWKRTA